MSFSTNLAWFNFWCDLEQVEPTQALTPSPSVVFEEIGSIKMMEGVTRATIPASRRLRIEQSVDLPPYANQATVFLNGWEAAYEDSDQHIYTVAAILGHIRVTPGQTIRWTATGTLEDVDRDETFTLTYRYMIIAWNDASVRAMVDHNDAEHFCRTGESHGDDNFFMGVNSGAADETTTALSSFPSFLRNPGFATGRQVAVLPRGFVFAWGGSGGGGTDHHLLQLAYNLESVAPFVRNQDYHKALAMLNPLANGAAGIANGEFVSWKTSVIFKDNSRRRDYSFVEFISAMGGEDVEIVQPEFVILPREDVDTNFPGGGPVGGFKMADIVIENLPYRYAVPLLTGWDIGYADPGEGDQHVMVLGVLMSQVRYERPPGSTGTLSYRVESFFKDEDAFPDNYLRHKVTILGLKRMLPAPPPPRAARRGTR